ncbi:glycosyltransferase [Mucilaginibacter sabulilitoris]|uniref:Glycosyltransferase n=1 Tax=Mucilaginibacter sabulilitoris TaxID=1173583 RepID=A0ABZ0TRP9_9SPHI|nr:glycosyltransferase [Mucilaginibacter sabulilitoris]WPU95803.1 glycosyltransferase [Mucilaginibacter sabulilitoris]
MRLVLIITDYGSFNNFLSEVAVELLKQGNDVHVICSGLKIYNYQDKYPYESMGIVFHFLNFPRSFNLLSQLTASKAIGKKVYEINPDLVNVHFTTGIFTTVIWKKLPFFTIGTIHGLGYPVIQGRLMRKIFKFVEKICFKRVDQIYLLNNLDFNLVKALHPMKAFKYNSYGVGCDLEKFNPDKINPSLRRDSRNSLSINADDFVLAFTGRFVTFKGFDILVKAMISIIKDAGLQDIRLLLIGGEDPAHKSGLSDEEEYFYKNHPQIIPIGFTGEVEQYLAMTDLFVFPSFKEGMPVCIMEALSMGIPVITSDSRGCNDLISDHFNGLLLSNPPSVEETQAAILKLYYDRILLKNLSSNALINRNQLSRDTYAQEQISIYKKILSISTQVISDSD